jgi:hypothetical protein
MPFMLCWKIVPGDHKSTAEIFLGKGAPVPPGVELRGRWHAPGSSYGWALLESDDTTALAAAAPAASVEVFPRE